MQTVVWSRFATVLESERVLEKWLTCDEQANKAGTHCLFSAVSAAFGCAALRLATALSLADYLAAFPAASALCSSVAASAVSNDMIASEIGIGILVPSLGWMPFLKELSCPLFPPPAQGPMW